MVDAIVLSVLKPFVSKLTEAFLQRRRNKVAIADLQDQVLRLVMSQRELQIEVQQAQQTILALTRYLVLTHADTFIVQQGHLELAAKPVDADRVVVGQAIQGFTSSVEASVQHRSRHARDPQSSVVSADTSSEALDRFFDGFAEEIMQARLGRGGANG